MVPYYYYPFDRKKAVKPIPMPPVVIPPEMPVPSPAMPEMEAPVQQPVPPVQPMPPVQPAPPVQQPMYPPEQVMPVQQPEMPAEQPMMPMQQPMMPMQQLICPPEQVMPMQQPMMPMQQPMFPVQQQMMPVCPVQQEIMAMQQMMPVQPVCPYMMGPQMMPGMDMMGSMGSMENMDEMSGMMGMMDMNIASSPATSDPPPILSNNPAVASTILHKELTGYPNYGNPSGNADILYTGNRGTWTFDIPGGLFSPGNQRAQLLIRAVLDDHYNTQVRLYSLRITINNETLHNGPVPLEHGTPAGQRFTNWRTLTFNIANLRRNSRIVIENTSRAGTNDWIAFDWMELRLSPR